MREQPKKDMQELLDDVLEATPDVIEFGGKQWKIHWWRNYMKRRFTHLMLKETSRKSAKHDDSYDQWKLNVKLVALLLLARKWKIVFFWWFYWRWLYYVVDLDQVEVLRVMEASKKKIPLEPSMMCTGLAISMMDTLMSQTKEEVGHGQAAPVGEPSGA